MLLKSIEFMHITFSQIVFKQIYFHISYNLQYIYIRDLMSRPEKVLKIKFQNIDKIRLQSSLRQGITFMRLPL